jgi:hypothetical protein
MSSENGSRILKRLFLCTTHLSAFDGRAQNGQEMIQTENGSA